jgi:uncharacterized membrane protein YozB (DUF420 family)
MPGFLGTGAPFMMDLVMIALLVINPALFWSIQQAKNGKYELHKKVQLPLALILLIAVVLFEIEIRLAGGIVNIIGEEKYTPLFQTVLYIHIFFSVTTTILWAITTFKAYKLYTPQGFPDHYRKTHRKMGWLGAIDLLLTTLTGFVVYYLGFLI